MREIDETYNAILLSSKTTTNIDSINGMFTKEYCEQLINKWLLQMSRFLAFFGIPYWSPPLRNAFCYFYPLKNVILMKIICSLAQEQITYFKAILVFKPLKIIRKFIEQLPLSYLKYWITSEWSGSKRFNWCEPYHRF